MRSGDVEHRGTEGAHIALMAPVNSSTMPREDSPPEHTEETPQPATAPETAPTPSRGARGRVSRWPWLVAVSAVILLGSLLLMLADAGQSPNALGHAQPAATATPSPTATATPIPSPTPIVGFQVYVDRSDGFLMQYPLGWVSSPANPGIEFADDTSVPDYIVQVLVPGNATLTNQTASASDPTTWVDFELDHLSKQWPQGAFNRLPGPTPQATIGGTTWQSGSALVSVGTTHIRVLVYATVRNGKPYIINVLASDDRFDIGSTEYFNTMLHSFSFLPAAY